ncbi:MAG: hypothetical protein AAGD25_03090 [Cyanobacteria bacterium P01_F01_bin.150]
MKMINYKDMTNGFLGKFGLRLTREPVNLNPYFHEYESSFVITEKLRNFFVRELTNSSFQALRHVNCFKDFSKDDFRDEVISFLNIFQNRPDFFKSNIGGSGFDNAFWIFLVSKLLSPSLVIESGVWKGQTSWLFEQACPKAKIHGFDISLSQLVNTTQKVVFHEQDWAEYELQVAGTDTGLCFFDCHISHVKRLKEAFDRGFKFILLDDNVPAHLVHAFSAPPLPSLEMILSEEYEPGDIIEWSFRGRKKKYIFQDEDFENIRELVEDYIVFPDIGTKTRYGRYSFLSFVKLK